MFLDGKQDWDMVREWKFVWQRTTHSVQAEVLTFIEQVAYTCQHLQSGNVFLKQNFTYNQSVFPYFVAYIKILFSL